MGWKDGANPDGTRLCCGRRTKGCVDRSLLVTQHPHTGLCAARHKVPERALPSPRLPAPVCPRRDEDGEELEEALSPGLFPVLLLSHAGSPRRGGGASRLPSSKKRSHFPWCWWVLQPPAVMELLVHRVLLLQPLTPQPSSQLGGLSQPAVYHPMAGLGAGGRLALLFITNITLVTSHLIS